MADQIGSRRPIVRLQEPALVACEEPNEDRVATAGPLAFPGHQFDRAQKANDVDERRTPGGVIEVVETPGVGADGKLLDMRVTVKANGRLVVQIAVEHFAHTGNPEAVDESEVVERIGLQLFQQLRRRERQARRVRPELSVIRHDDGKNHEQQSQASVWP